VILNVVFEGGLPENGFGLFAELAGTQRMSNATRALMQDPHGVSNTGSNEAEMSEADVSAVAGPLSAGDGGVDLVTSLATGARNGTEVATPGVVVTPGKAQLYARAMDYVRKVKTYRKQRPRADAGVRGVRLVQYENIAEKITCICPKEAREKAERAAAAAAAAAESAHQAEEAAAEKMSNAMAASDVEALENAMAEAEAAAAASAEADKEAVAKQDAAMRLSDRSVDDILTPAAKAEVAKAEAERHAPPKAQGGHGASTTLSTKAIDHHGDHGVSDRPVAENLTLVSVSAMMAI